MTGDLTPEHFGLSASRFPSYRPQQLDTAVRLADSERRWRLESAPTGAGKSLVNATAAKLIGGRALMLVGTKGLQDQLTRDFASSGAVEIKGHANYRCWQAVRGRGKGGTTSDDQDGECTAGKGQCLYRQQVERAQDAEMVIGNFAYWLSIGRYSDPNMLGEFDLLIMDEAHTAPDWLTRACALTFDRGEVRTALGVVMPKADDMELAEWLDWAGEAIGWAREGYRRMREEMAALTDQSPESAEYAARELARVERIGKMLRELVSVAQSEVKWLVMGGDHDRQVVFSPVWGWEYAERYLYRGIPNVIACSATLNEDTAKYLGIPRDEFDYIEVAGGFDPKRRPFTYLPTVRVDSRMADGEKKLLVAKMDRYIDSRIDYKGIVHSRSYGRAQEIYELSKWRDYMMVHSTRNAREVIEEFKRRDAPCILVSPSVEEGYDFIGDMCRWQVIVKVPFVDSRDPITNARLKEDKGYRNYCAALSIVQTSGRGMRSADDWCETAIFDEHWGWFSKKAKFPLWFKRAWGVHRGGIPERLEIGG